MNKPTEEKNKGPLGALIEKAHGVARGFKNTPKAFGLVWKCGPGVTIWMTILTLLPALLPAAQAWVGKLIVDSVVDAVNQKLPASEGFSNVAPYIGIEFALIFAGTLIGQARAYVQNILHARLTNYVNSLIIKKALALDLRFFEDGDFYDKMQNARRDADTSALSVVTNCFSLIQGAVTLLTLGGLLFRFSPWLAVILFAATAPSFIAQTSYADSFFRVISWRVPETRLLRYLEDLLTGQDSAKEIKLFNLGDNLLGRYNDLYWKFYKEDRKLAMRRTVVSLGWGLVSNLSYYGSYAWVLWRAVGGTITLGDMTMYLVIFRQAQGSFQSLFSGLGSLYEDNIFLDHLLDFLALQPAMAPKGTDKPIPAVIQQGIEFRNVSFKYANSENWVLRDVNIVIKPRERIALVGLNGAGKTTLIKLLTRLYDPTEGQILLDGVDLREYSLESLRNRIGVIFQDYVRYQLTAQENIGFGKLEGMEDLVQVAKAAEKGGSDRIIEKLPKGYQTRLGRRWGGSDLSIGEWQKVALSRAFMRDSDIVVLDEPTSSLDAEAEYAVFKRFTELTKGKIAVVISHRFSTVRIADRIIVLQGGRVIENGTHEELVALGGTYAHLFNVQAEGYR